MINFYDYFNVSYMHTLVSVYSLNACKYFRILHFIELVDIVTYHFSLQVGNMAERKKREMREGTSLAFLTLSLSLPCKLPGGPVLQSVLHVFNLSSICKISYSISMSMP